MLIPALFAVLIPNMTCILVGYNITQPNLPKVTPDFKKMSTKILSCLANAGNVLEQVYHIHLKYATLLHVGGGVKVLG